MKKVNRFKLVWYTLLGLLLLGLPVSRAFAAPLSVLPTTINLYEANAFRNVVQSGDLLYIMRYELPVAQWDPPTGPGAFAALTELYSDSSETILLGRRVTPVTGDGLTGIYLAPGHGLTWNSATIEFCITGDPITFGATTLQVCTIPVYNDGSTLSATSTVLGSVLLTMMSNLEQAADKTPTTYVSGGFITTEGVPFAQYAFQPITSVAPQVFFGALNRFNESAYTPVAKGSFVTTTETAAESSTFFQNLKAVAAENISIKGNALGFMGIFVVAIGTGAFTMVMTRSSEHAVPFAASAIFIIFFAIAVPLKFVSMEVMFTVLALITLVALFWITKRAPS